MFTRLNVKDLEWLLMNLWYIHIADAQEIELNKGINLHACTNRTLCHLINTKAYLNFKEIYIYIFEKWLIPIGGLICQRSWNNYSVTASNWPLVFSLPSAFFLFLLPFCQHLNVLKTLQSLKKSNKKFLLLPCLIFGYCHIFPFLFIKISEYT